MSTELRPYSSSSSPTDRRSRQNDSRAWEKEAKLGNLGKYQDIVQAAKEAGGVDKLIENIGEGAVSKAAPKIYVRGALAGALGTAATGVATGVVVMAAKRYLDNKKAREALAEDAKAHLKAAVENWPSAEGAGPESDEEAH
jgi:hypothetical protein